MISFWAILGGDRGFGAMLCEDRGCKRDRARWFGDL